ncbi:AraC family transcriptional regulator [Oceanicoccus sp. KOV_DT_Chl]|uniref:AraC family transcriptional regulator n=1 Tax=Oceanicoccus sp. KOV_DT_Chl TaxID=1904639 RepID=UPI000C7DD4B5|nr:AraC family transcriptional regulator [Oceanicoccus sp. KOV_DT_Chl]
MLTYSIIHCQKLRDAMDRAIEFNAVCRERADSVLIHELLVSADDKSVTLRYLSTAIAGQDAPQDGVLCSMAIWLRVCSWLIGKNIEVVAAGCFSPSPANRAGLQHFLPCPIEFDQSCNWLRFSASHLDAPIVRSESDLDIFLKVAPYHVVIKPVTNEQSVAERIRLIIGSDLHEDLPTFEQLTKVLNMSARTLRRRLDKEGTSYQRIKDSARRDAAIEYLNNSKLTVSDVAELVGFSDPSAFHRSFKRWTGLSPGEFR